MVAIDGDTADAGIAAAWAQVQALTPRLAPHVDKLRHSYRGEEWYVLADRMTAAHFRCTPAVERFLSLLDGEHSIAQAYTLCANFSQQQSPSKKDVLQLLGQLQRAKLLLGDAASSGIGQRQSASNSWLRRLASPMAVRIPLLDPDKFLLRVLPWVKPLFSRAFLYFWLLAVVVAAIAAFGQWSALGVHWQSRFLEPGNLLYLWLLYPVVKGLHELGHGFATRFWGGEVHEMGIMLLVFTPVPYVDASASSAFENRHQRIVVAGAGIMLELLLSALALWGWIYADQGLLRDLLFNVMVIGGFSTLLFNGNPLLRFDGYYVLSDVLEIPNLRARANQALGSLLRRTLLALNDSTTGHGGGREQAWLLSYALLSGMYSLFISFTIAFFIAGKYFFIGATLAIWLLVSRLVLPIYHIGSNLLQQARRQGRTRRLCAVTAGISLAVVMGLFVLPVPDSDHAEGIVTLPQDAQVRSRADGFVQAIFKRPGQHVQAQEALIELQNLELQARESVLLARAQELTLRHDRALSAEPLEREILKQELAALDDEIREVQSQLANLMVRSPQSGTFSLAQARNLPGHFVHKGDTLGHVISGSGFSARVVIPQGMIEQVLSRTRAVEIRLSSDISNLIQGGDITQVPLATSRLPSAMLGSRAGGDIAVDARDQAGRRALSSVFQLDVSLPLQAKPYLGQQAYVRFIYQNEPLGAGWYRQLRRLFLTRLGI